MENRAPEKTSFYNVEIYGSKDTGIEQLKMAKQLAYAVNPENLTILIGTSGHRKMLADYDVGEFEGGWIFPCNNKITFYSGSLGRVNNKDEVKEAIEDFLNVYLREAK